MGTTTPEQRMAAGYAAAAPRRTRAERVAAAYHQDDRMERLLELQRTDPAAFGRLPAATRLSIAIYANARSTAEALEAGDAA